MWIDCIAGIWIENHKLVFATNCKRSSCSLPRLWQVGWTCCFQYSNQSRIRSHLSWMSMQLSLAEGSESLNWDCELLYKVGHSWTFILGNIHACDSLSTQNNFLYFFLKFFSEKQEVIVGTYIPMKWIVVMNQFIWTGNLPCVSAGSFYCSDVICLNGHTLLHFLLSNPTILKILPK